MYYLIILFQLTLLFPSSIGSISGTIVDSDTHQPLPGANIILIDTDLGVSTDINGKFLLNNIPVGSYSVSASMIGYESQSRANINIYSNRQTPINFYLSSVILEADVIKVTAGFFEKAKDGIVSTQTIGIEEIRSDPIGSYDIQMMVHSLPSVVTATDQNNEIIVRGGGPGENLFVVDHLEIPNPNHFGQVGTGGGPVNILNTEFVERIDFFAGAFPARYGDKQSSVMDIHLREGNYYNNNLDFELSMAGVGFLIEGPITNKSSYISSYRKSFLKYIIKSAGLTSIPEYWNTQHKLTYNLNSRNKLIFNFIAGNDHISIRDENRPDLKGAENLGYFGHQYTFGLTHKSLFSKKGYYLISFGKTLNSSNASVYKNKETKIDTFFQRNNIESDSFIKWDLVYKFSPKLEFSIGVNTKYGEYKIDEKLAPDTLFTFNYINLTNQQQYELNNYDNYFDLIDNIPHYNEILEYNRQENYSRINQGYINQNSNSLWKYAGYAQIKIILKYVSITSGLRYDNVPYNKTSQFSIRNGLSIPITSLTKLNGSFGQYFQTPNYWILMNPNNDSILKHTYTNQFVLGLEHYFNNDTKGTLELYKKSYFNRPIQISKISKDNLDNLLGFTDIGEGNAHGIELYIQKKFASKWYGTMSYSYSKSNAKEYRQDKDGFYPWDFDIGNSLTIVGGYKFNFTEYNWYNNLKQTLLFKYLSFIPFMISDHLEISMRYRFSEGLPYTPKKFDFIHRKWYTDPNQNLNSERYGSYRRFDIMILRKFNLKNINITTFLDLQNVMNRNNDWELIYMDNGTYEMSYQYKQIPVGGIIIEF